MQPSPLLDELRRTGRQSAREHSAGRDRENGFMIAVANVEVRWIVIVVVHAHNEPEESADYGHALLGRLYPIATGACSPARARLSSSDQTTL